MVRKVNLNVAIDELESFVEYFTKSFFSDTMFESAGNYYIGGILNCL